MANRVVFYVTAAVVACPFTTGITIEKALAAGECIEQPNRQPGPGGHWYYRTDRGTGLKCWYVKEPDAIAPVPEPPKADRSVEATLQQETTPSAAAQTDVPAAPPLNRTAPDAFEE
jgi:hypothetical protein